MKKRLFKFSLAVLSIFILAACGQYALTNKNQEIFEKFDSEESAENNTSSEEEAQVEKEGMQ